jgi:hypothetical protein
MTAPEPAVVIPLDVESAEAGTIGKNKFGTTMVSPVEVTEETEHIQRPQDPNDPQDIRFIPEPEEETPVDPEVDPEADTQSVDESADESADEDDLAEFRDA